MTVFRLFAGHISGWVFAVISIVSIVASAVLQSRGADPKALALVLIWTAGLSAGAVGVVFVMAQYGAWKIEREHSELEKARNALPQITGEVTNASVKPYVVSIDDDPGRFIVTLSVSICNQRPVDTNVATMKLDGLELNPKLFFYDISILSWQHEKALRPSEIVLRRGIIVELVIVAFTKFAVPPPHKLDFSALKIALVDGFGGTHSIHARSGLELYSLGDLA